MRGIFNIRLTQFKCNTCTYMDVGLFNEFRFPTTTLYFSRASFAYPSPPPPPHHPLPPPPDPHQTPREPGVHTWPLNAPHFRSPDTRHCLLPLPPRGRCHSDQSTGNRPTPTDTTHAQRVLTGRGLTLCCFDQLISKVILQSRFWRGDDRRAEWIDRCTPFGKLVHAYGPILLPSFKVLGWLRTLREYRGGGGGLKKGDPSLCVCGSNCRDTPTVACQCWGVGCTDS